MRTPLRRPIFAALAVALGWSLVPAAGQAVAVDVYTLKKDARVKVSCPRGWTVQENDLGVSLLESQKAEAAVIEILICALDEKNKDAASLANTLIASLRRRAQPDLQVIKHGALPSDPDVLAIDMTSTIAGVPHRCRAWSCADNAAGIGIFASFVAPVSRYDGFAVDDYLSCCLSPLLQVALRSQGQFNMALYVSPDRSFSFYYPQGWTVQQQGQAVNIRRDPQRPNGATIELSPLTFQMRVSSAQLINVLAQQMTAKNNSFQLIENKALGSNPDVSAVTFTYQEGPARIFGFAIALCQANQAIWSSIYGQVEDLSGYNPSMVLGYLLQSLASGPRPNQPKITLSQLTAPASPAPAANQPSGGYNDPEYQKEISEKIAGTHMWNMAPYLYPNVFSY